MGDGWEFETYPLPSPFPSSAPRGNQGHNLAIRRDKTIADDLKFIPNDDTQNIPSYRLQLGVETFGY